MDGHSAPRERQRDATGPDSQLERASAACELGQEVHRGVDDRGVEQVRGVLVVPRGDALVEVAVVVHRRKLPDTRRARREGSDDPRKPCTTCSPSCTL